MLGKKVADEINAAGQPHNADWMSAHSSPAATIMAAITTRVAPLIIHYFFQRGAAATVAVPPVAVTVVTTTTTTITVPIPPFVTVTVRPPAELGIPLPATVGADWIYSSPSRRSVPP